MLLTNETWRLLPIQPLSTDEKHIRCLVNMKKWLLIHSFVTTLIHIFFVHIYIIFLFFFVVFYLFSLRFRRFIRCITSNIQLTSYAQQQRHVYRIILLIKEVALVFVYVLFAFLYKWFGFANNDRHITTMNFRRWLIEAAFIPLLFMGFVGEYYIQCISSIIFDEYQLFYILAITLKVPLFFLMRYGESQPDFFLNRFECYLISRLCKSLSK
jgi:hypothetical protein